VLRNIDPGVARAVREELTTPATAQRNRTDTTAYPQCRFDNRFFRILFFFFPFQPNDRASPNPKSFRFAQEVVRKL
jgi:hypothetical protein